MKGFLMMLKSMGIEIDPQEIERLRHGIPQLIIDVQAAVKNFDERLKAIEKRLDDINRTLALDEVTEVNRNVARTN
jgi:hypothetical protein